jgi:hypothetical protein
MSPELWGALVGLGVVWAMLRDQARQEREAAALGADRLRRAIAVALAEPEPTPPPNPVYVTPTVTELEPVEAAARFGATPSPADPSPVGFHQVTDEGRCRWCAWQRKAQA